MSMSDNSVLFMPLNVECGSFSQQEGCLL